MEIVKGEVRRSRVGMEAERQADLRRAARRGGMSAAMRTVSGRRLRTSRSGSWPELRHRSM